jgi:Uma2 family endonuclease
MAEATRTRITASGYYQLPAYKRHDLIQLIDGEVVIGMLPILKHQTIIKKILALFIQIEASKGGIAFVAPTEVYLDEHNVYEPDLVFVAPDHLAITQQDEKRIVGAPDLVVEVLSPSTARYDRGDKYRAYERHGVREYWIIDPLHDTLEVWTRVDGQFQRQGAYAPGMTFASSVLATEVAVKAIFDV